MNGPFNTTMRDRLTAALAASPIRRHTHKSISAGKVSRATNGRFVSLRSVCTNDGAWGLTGTPCPKCGRQL